MHPWLTFVHPVTGFHVASVHSISDPNAINECPCTQSFLHALLFEAIRLSWATQTPIYVEQASPGVETGIRLVDNYARGGSINVIARYFEERFRSVFPAVATPGVLRNSANCPLYLLCFAASNERGAKPALSIANHLLRPACS